MTDSGLDIFATTTYAAKPRPKPEFKPWHRPRKHFVRSRQWGEQLSRLITEFRLSEVRYLGLPGSDLLDIRAFHDGLPLEIKLRYLGFSTLKNDDDPVALQTSVAEVNRLPQIHEESNVLTDDIREIARQDSVASERMRKHGPYDIVNLDLCDSIFGESSVVPLGSVPLYSAIDAMFRLQRQRHSPWLLLITSRVDRGLIDESVALKLSTRLLENVDGCDGFLANLRDVVSSFSPTDGGELDCSDEEWCTLFSALLLKWLLGLAIQCDAKLELRSAMSYSVKGSEHDDLLSIALRITPVAQALDPAGIAPASNPPIDECLLANRSVRRLAALLRVDEVLSSDEDLLSDVISEAADLMERARYDANDFVDFAMASGT